MMFPADRKIRPGKNISWALFFMGLKEVEKSPIRKGMISTSATLSYGRFIMRKNGNGFLLSIIIGGIIIGLFFIISTMSKINKGHIKITQSIHDSVLNEIVFRKNILLNQNILLIDIFNKMDKSNEFKSEWTENIIQRNGSFINELEKINNSDLNNLSEIINKCEEIIDENWNYIYKLWGGIYESI